MINSIQTASKPITFKGNGERYYSYEDYAANARSRRVSPNYRDYNPKVSIFTRAMNGLAVMARSSRAKKFRSQYDWVMFSHNTVEEFRANRSKMSHTRARAVSSHQNAADEFVKMENLLERNVGSRFLELNPGPCEYPNRFDPSTSDITWYEKIDKRSAFNDYFYKITVPTYHCEGSIVGYDGSIRSSAKSYDFVNKLFLKNSREVHEDGRTYVKFSEGHSLSNRGFSKDDYASNSFAWSDISKIIRKPVSVEGGKYCPETNTLQASSMTVVTRDSAKNVKSSKTYINPTVQYYIDESGERRCTITADFAYELPERLSSFGNKTKYYKNISEVHCNPRDFVIEAENAIIIDDDANLSKCYGNYVYNSKTKHTNHEYVQDLNIDDIKTAFQYYV